MSLNKNMAGAIVVLAAFLLVLLPGRLLAEGVEQGDGVFDDREYAFIRGVVSGDEGWRIIVNEGKRIRITSGTEILDRSGGKTSRYGIKAGGWVYAEGPVDFSGDVLAEKVYMLPGYIGPDELPRYPFIKSP